MRNTVNVHIMQQRITVYPDPISGKTHTICVTDEPDTHGWKQYVFLEASLDHLKELHTQLGEYLAKPETSGTGQS